MPKLCIIPARGGSKRIPRKNVKSFLGKPIITYSIEAAIKSKLFQRIVVSTDDQEIAETAKNAGADVPFFRSSKNSDDVATTFSVVKEVLDRLNDAGEHYDEVCCLYPCAPFVTTETLISGLEKLNSGDFDVCFPVIEYGTPIQRSLRMNEGKLVLNYPEEVNTRTQDLSPTYFDAGQFYWLDVAKILAKGKIITDHAGGFVVSEMEAHDIDTAQDWEIAEFKYKLKMGLNQK